MRRRAEKRGSHNKAPRGSLCMQHSSGETRTFGASVMVLGRTTWMPGQPCQSSSRDMVLLYSHSSGTYCVSRIVCSFGPTAGCARRPEKPWKRHIAIAFHPSSDSSSRLARSVLTGEPSSRMAPAVAAAVVRRRRPPPPPPPTPPSRGPGACRRLPGLRSADVQAGDLDTTLYVDHGVALSRRVLPWLALSRDSFDLWH